MLHRFVVQFYVIRIGPICGVLRNVWPQIQWVYSCVAGDNMFFVYTCRGQGFQRKQKRTTPQKSGVVRLGGDNRTIVESHFRRFGNTYPFN